MHSANISKLDYTLICMHPRLSKYEWSDVRESRVFVQICVCIAPCTSDRNLVITVILRWLENPPFTSGTSRTSQLLSHVFSHGTHGCLMVLFRDFPACYVRLHHDPISMRLRVTYCNTAMNNSPFIDNLWQSTYLKKWRCSLISHSYVDIHLGYYVYIYTSYFIKYIIWRLTIDYPGQYTSLFHDWCKLDTYVIICIWIVWKFGIPKSKLQFCGIPVYRIHHFETQNPHNSLWRWYIPQKNIPMLVLSP